MLLRTLAALLLIALNNQAYAGCHAWQQLLYKRFNIPQTGADLLAGRFADKTPEERDEIYARLKQLPPIRSLWEGAYQYAKISTLSPKLRHEDVLNVLSVAAAEDAEELLTRMREGPALTVIEKRGLILMLTHNWSLVWRLKHYEGFLQKLAALRPSALIDRWYNNRNSAFGDAKFERFLATQLKNMPETFDKLLATRTKGIAKINAQLAANKLSGLKTREAMGQRARLKREARHLIAARKRWRQDTEAILGSEKASHRWFTRLFPSGTWKTGALERAEKAALGVAVVALGLAGVYYRFIHLPELPAPPMPKEFIPIELAPPAQPTELEVIQTIELDDLEAAAAQLQQDLPE